MLTPVLLKVPLTAYLRRLLVFLCLVSFFDGYDFYAISQTLPELRASFALTPAAGTRLLALVNLGTLAAYLLVRLADRWGRRPILLLCLAGYSGASFGSALAPGSQSFLLAQLAVRFFLVSALAMVVLYAVEEYPADRRGRILGMIQSCFSFGAIACAIITPRLVQTSLGWRAVYVLGSASAVLLLFCLLDLRETARFLSLRELKVPAPLLPRLLPSPHQQRMLQLAVIWILTFLFNQSTTVFWKEFARGERGFNNQRIGALIAIGAVVALPLVAWSGRLLDRIGRRRSATVIYLTMAAAALGAYSQLPERLLLVPLILLIAGTGAAVALLNAWTAESFPTDLRGDAFAWANSLLGRLGFVLAPLFVSVLVEPLGWGRAISVTAGFPLVALLLIWRWLPETAGKDLDEPAQLPR